MEKIIIEEKQTKTLRHLLVCFSFLLMSVAVWIIGMKDRKTLLWAFGFLISFSLSVRFLIIMGQLSQKKPLLTITFDGIIDSSSGSATGFIPFQDIERFCIVDSPTKKAIGIIPKDEEAFVHKLSPMKRETAKKNLNLKNPPFFLFVDNAKDISLEDIYTLLKKRLDDYSSLYD